MENNISIIMKDANGKILSIGDKFHPVGRGNQIRYVIEIGKNTVGISADKNSTSCYGINPEKLVKLKNQN